MNTHQKAAHLCISSFIVQIMKKLSLLGMCLVMMIACKDLEKLTEFSMSYSSNITIPKSTGLDLPVTVPTPDIETNSESEFAVNDTRKDMVEEIFLTGLDMTITSPDDQTFSFLESIRVYIVAEDLPEIEVAYQENVSVSAGSQLSLETTGENLREYIIKDAFNLRVKTVTDEVLSYDTDIKIDSRFFVNAKVLGL